MSTEPRQPITPEVGRWYVIHETRKTGTDEWGDVYGPVEEILQCTEVKPIGQEQLFRGRRHGNYGDEVFRVLQIVRQVKAPVPPPSLGQVLLSRLFQTKGKQ
jgi:hypothetical protein